MRKGETPLILTFSPHFSWFQNPRVDKAGYMKLAVRHYFPNPLRCFQCHVLAIQRILPRDSHLRPLAEAGHDSSDCKASEKCVIQDQHTSFSTYVAWKLRRVLQKKWKTIFRLISETRRC
ncbi:hypothetical protein AVEN_272820-1 [Araneus ventricosus]|uniref:Uncharacterized protein n=1 Tax=Araneus ventricosus TaxID=182803 RepID=A0A4Y2SZ64_ARAVE|nr:hypothetical protein AVEN_272820-1 [Araneus ventricosus]